MAEQQGTPEQQDSLDKNRFAAAKLCWQPRLYDPKLEKWLHRIDRPTRILWGAEDRIIPPAYGEPRSPSSIARREPQRRSRRRSSAAMSRQPQKFADEAHRFIAGTAP